MGVDSELILEYVNKGFGNGQVYVHSGNTATLIYHGPAGHAIYEVLKRFSDRRRTGSGNYYEQRTNSGFQWRERR